MPESEHIDASIEKQMATLQELIATLRALRKDLDVPEREQVAAYFLSSESVDRIFLDNADIIQKLARISSFEPESLWTLASTNTRTTATFTAGIRYEKQIDVAAERERLTKKLEQYEKSLASAERQLGNEAFLAKAPEHIVAGLKKQAAEMATLRQETLAALDSLAAQV